MMLIAGWTLAFLFAAGIVVIAVVCRKHLAQHFRKASEIDLEQFEGDMRNAVRDINFGGRQ